MFRYYKNADECYAYLSDVRNHVPGITHIPDFERSAWFTRGWTLQELLAPKRVTFLSAEWELLGHKCEGDGIVCYCLPGVGRGLNNHISQITGIHADVLRNVSHMYQLPIEQRVTWLHGRVTKKVEDLAYCLLGICNVFIPLVYGEGVHARQRLEEQVSKKKFHCGPTPDACNCAKVDRPGSC